MSVLLLLSLALVASSFMFQESDSGDSTDTALPDGPELPEPPGPDPDPEPDTGVTVTQVDARNVTVDVGEDETGSLVFVNYSDSEDLGYGLGETFEARLYLAPEGVSLPENGPAGDFAIPGEPYPTFDQLADHLGLELLASWDLGGTTPVDVEPSETGGVTQLPDDTRALAPEINANAPIAIYDVMANTDGDDVVSIAPDDTMLPLTPGTVWGMNEEINEGGGQNFRETDGDYTGTDGVDGIVTVALDPTRITLDGGAGDDFFSVGAAHSVDGGAGADDIHVTVQPHETTARGVGGGHIEFADAQDSLTIHLPPVEEGRVYAITTENNWGEATRLGEEIGIVLIQAPPGVEVPMTAHVLEGFFMNGSNPHGLEVVTSIDLGARTGFLGDSGFPVWTEGQINTDPDITYVGTLSGSATVQLY